MNDESNNSTPPAAPAAVAAPAEQPTPAVQQPVAEDPRIAAMELELSKLREELGLQKLQTSAAKANKPFQPLNTGADDARRQNAITTCGGVAKWHALSATDRAKILNDGQCPDISDEKLGQYFGSKSSATEASRLAREIRAATGRCESSHANAESSSPSCRAETATHMSAAAAVRMKLPMCRATSEKPPRSSAVVRF